MANTLTASETVGRKTGLIIGLTYIFIIFARGYKSLDHLPPDPGYDYIADALTHSMSIIFSRSEPYFHMLPRIIAEIVVLAPTRMHAIYISVLSNIFWAACAFGIFLVAKVETKKTMLSAIAGAILLLVPTASESSIGNIGDLKWPLTTFVFIACCSISFVTRHQFLLIAVTIILGLSQPLIFLCLLPLLYFYFGKRKVAIHTNLPRVLVLVLLVSAVQLLQTGIDAAAKGRGSVRTFAPWPGMGAFWWSGLIGPIFLTGSIAFLLICLNGKKFVRPEFFALSSSLALITSLSCYWLGGIGDRYFTTPLTMTIAAFVLLSARLVQHQKLIWRICIYLGWITIFIPTVKWFQPMYYLTDGPRWSQQVNDMSKTCNQNIISEVEIKLSQGPVQIPCELFK